MDKQIQTASGINIVKSDTNPEYFTPAELAEDQKNKNIDTIIIKAKINGWIT